MFFNKYDVVHHSIEWKLPWLLLAIGTAFNLLLSPIIAFIEGLGKVKEVALIRFVQQVVHPIVIWGGLVMGTKLFVSGADAILRVLVVGLILVSSPFYKTLRNIWIYKRTECVHYMKEIFHINGVLLLVGLVGILFFSFLILFFLLRKVQR